MPRKISEISRYLESLSTEELAEEIKKLHKLFPEVREYYQVQLQDNGEEVLLLKCKKFLQKSFSPYSDYSGPKLGEARKAVNDFIKLSNNSLNIAEVMIYYAEMGVKFTNDYGDINEAFYASVESMYEKAAVYVSEHELKNQFVERFKKMVEVTDGIGWGFHDTLGEIYFEHFDLPLRKS